MSDFDLPLDLTEPARTLATFATSSLLSPVAVVDGGGLIEQISPAGMADLRLSPDIAVAMPVESALGISLADLQTYAGPTAATRLASNGRTTLRWRALPLEGMRADGGWLVEFHLEHTPPDASHLAERSARLEDLLDDLTERFEALNRYVGLISHDLQAPARRLLSFVELMREDLVSGGDPTVKLDSVERGARHLLRLTTELLQYSRLGKRPILLEPVDAQVVLDETLEQLALAMDDVGATVEVERPLPLVTASPTFLGVVFQNLVENALKYRRDEAPRVRITWSEAGEDNIRIDVTDNGTGIADENHDAVFQPFRRLARESQENTGLGLATVRDLVQRFGGTIHVSRSVEGEGSTFTLTLLNGT